MPGSKPAASLHGLPPKVASVSFMRVALSTSMPPTTMQVREATVGPLSGTRPVSGGAISTNSAGTPRASPTIWAKMVTVPWPISVDAERDFWSLFDKEFLKAYNADA